MNQSLEKRLSALEKTAPQAEKVIFIILVGMGEVGVTDRRIGSIP